MSNIKHIAENSAPIPLRRLRRSKNAPENGSRKVPTAEVGAIVIVMPLVIAVVGVRIEGKKLQVAPAGKPEQLSFNCWLKPFCGVTVSSICPEFPGATDIVVCASCNEKSCGAGGAGEAAFVTVTVTAADVDGASLASPL